MFIRSANCCFFCFFKAALPQYYNDLNELIVGGEYFHIEDHPYTVSLRLNNNHICGGSIVSSTYVLSAAHCVNPNQLPSSYSFRAGSSNRLSGGTVYQVDFFQRHPQYNIPVSLAHDVAMLRVTENMVGPNIDIIPIATQGVDLPYDSVVYIKGWGHLQWQGGTLPTMLQGTTVRTVSHAECQTIYGGNSVSSE